MNWLLDIKWAGILHFDISPLEIFIRGSLIYLALFLLIRFFHRRQAGGVGLTDVLVIVLIADAAQNGMAADYKSVPAGILLVATIIFWNYSLEFLAFRFPIFEKLVHPQPLPLIKNGRMLRYNMRREFLTEDELMSQLREEGFDKISQIKSACLEGDGKISVVSKNKNSSK